VLRVIGPADASISVDGRTVGHGTWHTESIAAGKHHVVVSLSGPAGCTAAQDSKTVRVAESGTTTVQLTPRRCGSFTLDAEPAGAQYVVASGGREIASGVVPMSAPAQLPEGTYSLHISAKYCADYTGTVAISSSTPAHERVRLICQ
jgi:hypothetical protein